MKVRAPAFIFLDVYSKYEIFINLEILLLYMGEGLEHTIQGVEAPVVRDEPNYGLAYLTIGVLAFAAIASYISHKLMRKKYRRIGRDTGLYPPVDSHKDKTGTGIYKR